MYDLSYETIVYLRINIERGCWNVNSNIPLEIILIYCQYRAEL